MIAIGILGVGLLMVAATFPVGLDQSRIVTEQTIAPLVGDDAFQRLNLLVNEPAMLKRIPVDAKNPDPTDLTKWPYSVRESIQHVVATQIAAAIPALVTPPCVVVGPIRSHLPSTDPDTTKWTGINELLVAPYVPPAGVGQAPLSAGVGTRFYPSIAAKFATSASGWKWSLPLRTDALGQPSFVEPPYTWSVLYQVYSVVPIGASPTITSYVRFFVFVNRRGEEWPKDWPKPITFTDVKAGVMGANEIWVTPEHTGTITGIHNRELLKRFSEGGFLVLDDSLAGANAKFLTCRIKQIELAKNPANSDETSTNPEDFHRIVLDQATPAMGFWFVPADSSTGRSPCIGVYSRTFSLQ